MKRGARLQPQAQGRAHSIGSFFRDLDLFGEPVALKYKGRSSSNSILGGLISIIYVAGVILYLVMLITSNQLVSFSNQTALSNNDIKLFREKFDFSVGLISKNKLININTIGQYFQQSLYQLSNGVKTEIQLEPCNQPSSDTQLCSINNQQTKFAKDYAIYFEIDYCKNTIKCKSKAEADALMKDIQFYFPTHSYYINTNFKIQTEINTDIQLTLHNLFQQTQIHKLHPTTVNQGFSILSKRYKSQTTTFLKTIVSQSFIQMIDQFKPLAQIKFNLDSSQTITDIRPEHFLPEILAFTGGFAFLIWIVVKAIIAKVTEQNLMRRIMKRVFLQDIETIINKSGNKVGIDMSTSRDAENEIFAKVIQEQGTIAYFRKLRAITYGAWFHTKRRIARLFGINPSSPQEIIIDRATQKVQKNLDIVRILKSLRKVELLSRVILSQPQRYMAPAAKSNVISAAKNWIDSENDDKNDFDWASVSTDAQLRTVLEHSFKKPIDLTDSSKRFAEQFLSRPSKNHYNIPTQVQTEGRLITDNPLITEEGPMNMF